MITTTPYYASTVWPYLIQTPANPLIYMASGYSLKVRCLNLLPTINLLILLYFRLNIFVDSILFYDFL
jgi:hypothetical protein